MSGGFEDWDHYTGTAELDASQYTSSPSSLKRTSPGINQYYWTLTKAAAAQSLADGRVVSQLRSSDVTDCNPGFVFRYQDTSNYYLILLNLNVPEWTFRKIDGGGVTDIGSRSLTFSPAANTWYKWRATLWTSEGHAWARLEYWNGSSWVKQNDDLSDPSNHWPTGGRIGVGGMWGTSGIHDWFDDTEIWG
jgi:hypothetical protein